MGPLRLVLENPPRRRRTHPSGQDPVQDGSQGGCREVRVVGSREVAVLGAL